MEFLKALFGGKALTYEEMVQAINAHNGDEANKDKQIKVGNLGGGEYVSKAKHDALQELLNGKNTELDTANNLIADLKKSTKGNEELQGKVTAYEQQVAQLQEQLKQTQLDSEIKVALLAAKATDVPYLTFKLKENGTALEMGEDGKIKGIDDLITGLKTQFPSQFETVTNKNIIDVNKFPNTNQPGGGISQEQFNKMGYQGRLKLKQEQPEVYAQMTGKATE
jgi:hypothetical protein